MRIYYTSIANKNVLAIMCFAPTGADVVMKATRPTDLLESLEALRAEVEAHFVERAKMEDEDEGEDFSGCDPSGYVSEQDHEFARDYAMSYERDTLPREE